MTVAASRGMGRMKILQVHTLYRQKGGEKVAVDTEAQVLSAAGHEVVQHHEENPLGHLRTAGSLAVAPWNAAAAARVAEVARRVRPDVAHVHNTWFALSPAVFSGLRECGVPIVVTLHNYRLLCANGVLYRDGAPCQDCVGGSPWHGVRHRCYHDSRLASITAAGTIALHRARRTWERDVDLFLALSEFARGLHVAGGLDPDKVVVKPNLVADGPRRVASPSASDTVLYVGRLSAEKGVQELLEAWTRSSVQDHCRLEVIGDGPLRSEVERVAGRSVQLLGELDGLAVRERMAAARALVFPSRWYEPFGLVMAEAMAAGLPILATRIGAVSEVVGDDAGWLLPDASAAAWSIGLQRLLDDADVDRTGRRGRARYESMFAAGPGLRALEEAYERVQPSMVAR